MFFVFPFLLLSIYFSETNNFVLKRDSQGPNFKQNDKDLIFQGVQNDSSVFPTRKSVLRKITKTHSSNPIAKQFNKRQSEDFPIKRHIQENDEDDISSMFKNTKSSTASSARDPKRKWPVVELLSHSDGLNENEQYFDDYEKKEIPFSHDIERESKVTEFSPKYINRYVELNNNHSKIKPVGLRSLSQQKFSGLSCEDGDQCVCRLPSKTGKTNPTSFTSNKCTRTTIVYSLLNFYVPYEIVNIPKHIPTGAPKPTTTPKTTTAQPPSSIGIDMGFPLGIPMGVPMGIPMGIPASYPAGYPPGYPAAYPAVFPGGPMPCAPGLPSYYQPNMYKEVSKHKKPSKTRTDDYEHYDGDDDEQEYIYNYDQDSIGKKRKHEKQHKGDILVDIEYDIEERRDHKPNQNFKCRHDKGVQATDIFKDIRKSQSDTIIKDCYCCTASSFGVNFRIVFLMLILVTFC